MRYRVCAIGDIEENGIKRFMIEGESVLIARVNGEYFAISDSCSHSGASLSGGKLANHCIQCPDHGSWFDLRTGEALSLPAVAPVEKYEVHIEEDEIYLDLDF
ncbi:MAG: Rieske (2Fe-2S) protein [Candidatus Glassbacteria bacterium]